MKFLGKDPASRILVEGLVYRSGAHNDRLLDLLCVEQRGYCAYTEKRLSCHDTVVVEHFNRRLKDTSADDYYNYYAALQSANQRKRRKEAAHENAAFFQTLFFQQPGAFELRIGYVVGANSYEELDPSDAEARDLIDFLGFNDYEAVEERRKHVARLRDIFERAQWTKEQQLEHLGSHRDELSYPTALAAALDLDLDRLLHRSP